MALAKDLVAKFQESSTAVKVGVLAGGSVAVYATMWAMRPRGKKAPPTYAPGLPLIGGTLAFLKDPLALIMAGFRAKGGVFQMRIVTKQFCFLVGPEAHAPFYTNSDQVLDQAQLYAFTVPVFGPKVVFDVEWAVRKQQLGFVRDRFALRHMNGYVNLVKDEAEALFGDMMARGGNVNIREEMMELLTRTSTACLMGTEVRAALNKGVGEYLSHLEQGMQSYSVFAPFAPTDRHRKRDFARKKMGEIFTEILAERRKATESRNDKMADMIDKFLNSAYAPSGKKLTDEEITGLCIAAFFGGMHNSAITTAWTLLYIHDKKNKNILSRLRAEQAHVKSQYKDGLDYKALKDMPLLKACVKEVLRLRPPLVILMRTLQSWINVCGYDVAPGTVVVTCPPVAHRIETIYEDPESFNPDRWMTKDEKDLPPHSFIAFGGGARRCLGEHFGELQVMTIVSHVLQNYDVDLAEGCPGAGFQGMVVGPEGQCRAALKPLAGAAGGA